MYNNFAGNYDISPFSTKDFYNVPLGEGSIVISRGDVIFDSSDPQNILSIADEKSTVNELFNVHISNKRGLPAWSILQEVHRHIQCGLPYICLTVPLYIVI